MKKFIVVDDRLNTASAIFTEIFDSEKKAIEYAENCIAHMTKDEIKKCNGLYVGIGEVDEDGDIDFDSIDTIKDYI